MSSTAHAASARRHDRLFAAAGIAAVLTYFGARLLLKAPETPFRVAIALVPVPFFLIFLFAAVRMARGLDELEQRIHLEALAFAFPAVLVVLLTLGLLQVAGVALSPQDWSYRHVWAFAFAFYFGGLALARRRYQ
jgi:hypothetical protein